MSAAASSEARWDQRIARAQTLAAAHPAVREALTFYAALAQYQRSLANELARGTLDVEAVLVRVPDFLVWLSREAPATLAAAALEMRTMSIDEWRGVLAASDLVFCRDVLVAGKGTINREPAQLEHRLQNTTSDARVGFVAEALLQPLAELALQGKARTAPLEEPTFPTPCPACGALPVLPVLREEGQGAKRALQCSLCLGEWSCRRILCPQCGEQRFDALPVYTAEQFEYQRVEACSTCRHYIKTIDLTQNGLAVPTVDDIASVALDLWAREQGYVRIKANLLSL